MKSIFLFLLIGCNSISGQNEVVKKFTIDQYKVIEIDSISLDNHDWFKCVDSLSLDTVIILKDKKLDCSMESLKLETMEQNALDKVHGLRVPSSNIYINDKLMFPEDMQYYNCVCN